MKNDLLLKRLTLAGDYLNLRNSRLLDELSEVEAADVAEETELESAELQAGEIEAVEQTELLKLEDLLELLELEQGVEVKAVALEQVLEGEHVEVVDRAEASSSWRSRELMFSR